MLDRRLETASKFANKDKSEFVPKTFDDFLDNFYILLVSSPNYKSIKQSFYPDNEFGFESLAKEFGHQIYALHTLRNLFDEDQSNALLSRAIADSYDRICNKWFREYEVSKERWIYEVSKHIRL